MIGNVVGGTTNSSSRITGSSSTYVARRSINFQLSTGEKCTTTTVVVYQVRYSSYYLSSTGSNKKKTA